MKRKTKLSLILCVIGVLLVGGCTAAPQNVSDPASGEQPGEKISSVAEEKPLPNVLHSIYNINHEKVGEIEGAGVLMQIDDSIIYSKVTATHSVMDEDIDYYRYILETNEHIKLGSTPHFYQQPKDAILIDNHLYLYIVSELDFPDKMTSRLMDVDLNHNTMSELFADEEGSSYISMALVGDRILIAKVVNDGSWLQEYNLETGELNSLMRSDFDSETNTGEMIWKIARDDSTISLLMLTTQTEGDAELRMDTYDYNMNFLRFVDLSCVDQFSAEQDGSELSQGVQNFSVRDNYVYYGNFSITRFLGKIEGDTVIPVMEKLIEKILDAGLDFRMSPEIQTTEIKNTFLFIPMSDPDYTLYLFDCRDGSLKRAEFHPDDERYSLVYAERTPNDRLMIGMSYREPDTGETFRRIYAINMSDLDFK